MKLKSIICSAIVTFAVSYVFAAGATVISTTGKVEVNRNNVWVTIGTNSAITEGEVISTGFNSEALIRYNGSVMRLGPLTRITLEKLATSEKKDDVSVYVSTGAVRSSVKHTENKRVTYTVRNPVAVASVRGTDFLFINTGKAVCYQGAVALEKGSSFNAKIRGIKKPADGSEGASEEDVKAAESALPAEGESNSATSAKDVNPYEKGGVIITAGLTTEIDARSGNPSPAKNVSAEKTAGVITPVPTASGAESKGSSNSALTVLSKDNSNSSNTASVSVSITLDD